MKRALVFYDIRGRQIIITREFNDERHQNNFIYFMERKFNYVFDEIYEVN
jgi:hypothetical protein